MHLAQDEDMVDAFAPDRSDQSFGKAILPRWACDDAAIDANPIAD
jgi:hypothetical protein